MTPWLIFIVYSFDLPEGHDHMINKDKKNKCALSCKLIIVNQLIQSDCMCTDVSKTISMGKENK